MPDRIAKKSRVVRAASRSEKLTVTIAQVIADDRCGLLLLALEQAGFWKTIGKACRAARVPAADFRIVIKPDLEMFRVGDPNGTDPVLVELLIDALHDHGFTQVVVADGRNAWDLWLENRDVPVLAELVGYRYLTSRQRPYDIVDLSTDVVPVAFPPESVLHGTGLGRTWAEAHFRINFAKNKTDEEYGYALCVHNLLGILPLRDKDYHYHHRLSAADVCAAVHQQTPAHFNLIDAFISNHGGDGSRAAHPLETRTIIASRDAVLADWAGSLKMGLDPYTSEINAGLLRRGALPARYAMQGDLAPYVGWINVPPLLMDSVRKRNASPGLSRLVKPWLQSVDRTLFPFKDVINDRVNAVATKYLRATDTSPAAFWMLVGSNYGLALLHRTIEAYQIKPRQRTAALERKPRWDFDPAAYSPSDFEAVVDYMKPLAQIVRATPPESNGLRWRYLDGSVLFEFSQLVPIPFEKFVDRVDIARSVQSMNDYIGGACVPVARDSAGRVVFQAERNIYLPQPNWIAFFGGPPIDVGKLEYIEYGEREQRIFWRAIQSSNGSAEFDDGIVTFAAEDDHQTRITIMARQKFALPLFWQAVNVDLAPRVKSFLLVDAYTRYFRQTIANFEAQYQGRESRIGHAWNLKAGENGAESDQRLETIIELLGTMGKAIGTNLGDVRGLLEKFGFKAPGLARAGFTVDDAGFRHFAGRHDATPPSRDGFDLGTLVKVARTEGAAFLSDLAEAMRKDVNARAASSAVETGTVKVSPLVPAGDPAS